MEQVVQFLQTQVMGKNLYTDPLTYQLEAGRLEGVYEDQMSFSNLKYSSSGFCFDLFVISSEKIYRLDEVGQRSGLRQDFSGVALFRYELAQRRSTGRLTGAMRFVSATGVQVPAEAVVSGVYDLELTSEQLSWREKQILYRDQPGEGKTYRPVAFDARNRLFLHNGRLHYEYDGLCYDIDGVTLEARLSQDTFPRFLSRERGR